MPKTLQDQISELFGTPENKLEPGTYIAFECDEHENGPQILNINEIKEIEEPSNTQPDYWVIYTDEWDEVQGQAIDKENDMGYNLTKWDLRNSKIFTV